MYKIASYRLKATILEPMFALMIILFSLTASFLIVVKAARHTNIQQQIRASAEVDRVMTETIDLQNYLDETTENEGLRIVKEISAYNNNKNLLVIFVAAFDNHNRLLVSRKKIIIPDENRETEQ